ncbi:hypothetical protein COY07_04640 [Candidatus Peregrinibacteria bacterium CG_4_10_14_0_2_um_filter_43_11]|nr:MAG: hypothetical protein COY07_04640 [Candidatus Peregrinibacteria bacterium CG_4_10_14_0_2_um_filter_43_11]
MLDPNEQLGKMLEAMPRFKRSKSADIRFRFRLFKKQLQSIGFALAIKRFASITVTAVFLFAVGGSAYAQQSHVTRGDFLYSFKQLTEKAELALANTPQKKVEKHLKFAKRRQEELEVLLGGRPLAYWIPTAYAEDDGEDVRLQQAIEDTANDMVGETEAAMEASSEIEVAEEIDETLGRIEAVHEEQSKWLSQQNARSERLKTSLESVRVVTQENWAAVTEVRSQVQEALNEDVNRPDVLRVKIAFEKQEEEKRPTERSRNDRLDVLEKQVAQGLRFTQERLNAFRTEMEVAGVEPEVASELTAKMTRKMEEAKQALEEGMIGKASGLSRATESMLTAAPKRIETSEHPAKIEDLKEVKEEVVEIMGRKNSLEDEPAKLPVLQGESDESARRPVTQKEPQKIRVEPQEKNTSPAQREERIEEDKKALERALYERENAEKAREKIMEQEAVKERDITPEDSGIRSEANEDISDLSRDRTPKPVIRITPSVLQEDSGRRDTAEQERPEIVLPPTVNRPQRETAPREEAQPQVPDLQGSPVNERSTRPTSEKEERGVLVPEATPEKGRPAETPQETRPTAVPKRQIERIAPPESVEKTDSEQEDEEEKEKEMISLSGRQIPSVPSRRTVPVKTRQ